MKTLLSITSSNDGEETLQGKVKNNTFLYYKKWVEIFETSLCSSQYILCRIVGSLCD